MSNFCQEYQNNKENPFYIVPWDKDYLFEVQKLIDCLCSNKENPVSPQDIVLVFPNTRPKRYLTARYKRLAKERGKANILPQILTNTEFYKLCLSHYERGKALFRELDPLDRYAKLYEIVQNVFVEKKELSHFFATLSIESDENDIENESLLMAKFYPWASSLDKLFEECFQHLVLPQNIDYTEGEVAPFASHLLSELHEIYEQYLEFLEEENVTTTAHDMFKTAEYIKAYDAYQNYGSFETSLPYLLELTDQEQEEYFSSFVPYLLQDKIIIFAGFVQLTGAENVILKHFWQKGAIISLHTDSKLVTYREKTHYSCIDHKIWVQKWQAETFLACEPRQKKPTIHFLSAFDVHSQLKAMNVDLLPYLQKNNEERDDTLAILLPSPSLLMPVLHELPSKNINISIGYPIKRTLLWQYIEILFQLQLTKKVNETGTILYDWETLTALLHHPYTKMLLSDDKENYLGWRKSLYQFDKQLSLQKAMFPLHKFYEDFYKGLDNGEFTYEVSDELEAFWDKFIKTLIFDFENIYNLADASIALQNVIELLIYNGKVVWNRFPLDKEALVRVLQNALPTLLQNSLADEEFPLNSLFHILEQLILEERVPFEADPLTGVQVLGMLESRLLRFDTVFILDMTESNIPGVHSQDPLMPDSLRNVIGLSDSHSRENIMAHTFYRLIQGANDVYCYWQQGVPTSEIQSSKSIRSRFVEELIWEKEKEQNAILAVQEMDISHLANTQNPVPCIRMLMSKPLAPLRRQKKGVVLTDKAMELCLKDNLPKKISATALDTYLHCPAQFYYKYLAKINVLETVGYGDNPKILGDKIHKVLNKLYEKSLNKPFEFTEENQELLEKLFAEEFNKENWEECFSPDSYFMMQKIGLMHLKEYLENAPTVTPLALEEEYLIDFELQDNPYAVNSFSLQGITDRIDKRNENEYWIVDYKTGVRKTCKTDIWKQKDFIEKLGTINKNKAWASEEAYQLLQELALLIDDIQLPYYLYLFGKNLTQDLKNEDVKLNASWVFIKERKEEKEVSLLDVKKEKKKTKEENEQNPEDIWEQLKEIRVNSMQVILDFLLNHIVHAKEWKCFEGKYCSYCPYKDYC